MKLALITLISVLLAGVGPCNGVFPNAGLLGGLSPVLQPVINLLGSHQKCNVLAVVLDLVLSLQLNVLETREPTCHHNYSTSEYVMDKLTEHEDNVELLSLATTCVNKCKSNTALAADHSKFSRSALCCILKSGSKKCLNNLVTVDAHALGLLDVVVQLSLKSLCP